MKRGTGNQSVLVIIILRKTIMITLDSAINFILRSENHYEEKFKKIKRFLVGDLVFNIGI